MKKGAIPIIDLHCDLLSYLRFKEGRTPQDALSRSSLEQMQEGGVKVQTLAIFGEDPSKSLKEGVEQILHFQKLLEEYSLYFSKCEGSLDTPAIQLLPAIESASVFALESEPLSTALHRLENIIDAIGPLFYISLTWNNENRFGGGNAAPHCGLKSDGKYLLEWMHGKKIAVDLSHTSDKLAFEMLDFIDQQSLDIPLLASHSNFRAIANVPRNLPEELVREIIRRQGIIGLNLCAPFIHPTDPTALVRHVEYALSLGAQNALCFGSDFFCDHDFPDLKKKYAHVPSFYFPEYSNSSCYPGILKTLTEKLNLTEEQMLQIAGSNAARFLQERILPQN